MPPGPEPLIPPHGGYRNLKTFQLARLIYDVTVRFCDKYVDRRSRTHDQMVQAARSGPQNIAEGSADSATSRKSELKLTGVAKGSLEELQLDYQDWLRQRDLPEWPPEHPVLKRFKARRVATLNEFRRWVADEVKLATRTDTDVHGQTRTDQQQYVRAGLCTSVSVRVIPPALLPPTLVANGALSLLNVCIHLLRQQLASQADDFVRLGGFTERLYRVRSAARGTRG